MAPIYFFIVAALLASARTVGAGSTSWPPTGYVEVRAYLYNLDGEPLARILKQAKLHATVWNPKGAALSKAQIATVQRAVADYHPDFHRIPAGCYYPRHAFVYYDAQQKPVGFVEICFSCWGYRTSPEHSGDLDFETLKKIFVKLNIPVFDNEKGYLSLNKRKAKQ